MKKLYLLILLLITFQATWSAASPAEEGKTIFTARCASCHNLNKVMTGPALSGVQERRDINWLVSFIRSSQTMVKAGDEQATKLFKQFNNIPMPDHKDLSDENIRSIIDYIKSAPSTATEKAPFAKPRQQRPAYLPLNLSDDLPLLVLFVSLVGFLVLALVFAVYVKDYQRNKLSHI